MGPLTLSLDFPRIANDSVEDLGIFLIVCRGRFQGYKQLSTGLSKSNAYLCPAPGLQSKAQIPQLVFPERARRCGDSGANVRIGGAARAKAVVKEVVVVVLLDAAHGWLRGQRTCVCPWLSAARPNVTWRVKAR